MKLITIIHPELSVPELALLCQPDDAILLRQDAVWLVRRSDISWPVHTLYVLQSDLQLRQLQAPAQFQLIDARRWVELTAQAQQVLLWQH